MMFSPQQAAAIEFARSGKGSGLVVAVAGAGKTTTLVEMCKVSNAKNIAFAAYNKAIAAEIGTKLEAAGLKAPRVRSGTFHSFGFSNWRQAAPKVRVDKNDEKTKHLLEQRKVPDEFHPFVSRLVSLAKQRAFGVLIQTDDYRAWVDTVAHFDLDDLLPADPSQTAEQLRKQVQAGIAHAWHVLHASTQMDYNVVNFDDMIYAPLVHGARVWPNDLVLVDEAQDTNPARRALAKMMLRPGGRLIAVGDPHQAIYGFTGADNDSLEIIRREFNCTILPLTVTYRCPKAVVEHAHQWVEHITAADTAPEGVVRTMKDDEFRKLTGAELGWQDVVICRNTQPLVELAFDLIRRRIPCHIEGRDIGAGLIAFTKKWKSVTTVGALRIQIDDHLDRETERLMSKGQEQKADNLADKVATLHVIMEDLADDAPLSEVARIIETLFEDTEPGEAPKNVTLCTAHRSKGREWVRVYLLGRNVFMPSPYARQQWQAEQEDNLCYVSVTRAMQELVEVWVDPRKYGRRR
jgi:superfamily I DNA/RNA helicase